MCVAGLSAVQEEELGQGEDNVTIEDVTNNPAAQANLDNTHDQNIIEPDPDGHALVRFVYVFASHAVFRKVCRRMYRFTGHFCNERIWTACSTAWNEVFATWYYFGHWRMQVWDLSSVDTK